MDAKVSHSKQLSSQASHPVLVTNGRSEGHFDTHKLFCKTGNLLLISHERQVNSSEQVRQLFLQRSQEACMEFKKEPPGQGSEMHFPIYTNLSSLHSEHSETLVLEQD